MEAFRNGVSRGIARENLAGRFYKTFYYWNRAQATCCELQESANYAFRRAQSGRALIADQLQDRFHTQKLTHAFRDHHIRGFSSQAEQHNAIPKEEARLGLNTSNINIQPSLATHVRHLMRRVPHPVVVITSADPADVGQSAETAFRGMTVSSFNTVTLEPVPLVSFNVRIPSATYTAMTTSGSFLAHFLVGSEEGARIADAFARGGNTQGGAFRELAIGKAQKHVRIFSGSGTDGAPLIAGSGVMQVLHCRVLEGKSIEIGDHVVVIAEVVGILAQPGVDSSVSEKAFGLAYCDRAYRTPGDEIDLEERKFDMSAEPPPEETMQRTLGLNVRRGDEATL